ncbi:MAG: 5'/3'-nucleotidase SurE [bacterium]|nr:5'/3'-nucleotidase SurE [bacterium]
MKILITNDDGIGAEGIRVLADELSKIGEVTVVAPDGNRSAVGHGVSFFTPLRIWGHDKENWHSCSGTPADCIIAGLYHIMKDNRPDIIVTGINKGANLGDDFNYSGTISSAKEGALAGIPSIAVSNEVLQDFTVPSYTNAAKLAAGLALEIFRNPIPERSMLNLNVPAGEIKGIRTTHLGKSSFTYRIIQRKDTVNLDYFWAGRNFDYNNEKYQGSDKQALDEGYASITPLNLDFTPGSNGVSFWDGRHPEDLMKYIK